MKKAKDFTGLISTADCVLDFIKNRHTRAKGIYRGPNENGPANDFDEYTEEMREIAILIHKLYNKGTGETGNPCCIEIHKEQDQ